VKSQPNFQVRINKRPSNFEPEEYSEWEQDPQEEEWQMGEVQPQEPEEMEDWERVTNGPDMARIIGRSPSPPENEWNPTLNGTLRIRKNDPRKCEDEVPKHLKTHMPPPPPPPTSPILAGPSNWSMREYCWNCKGTGHNIHLCPQNMQPTSKVSNKMPLQKEKPSNKNNKTKIKCSKGQQQGHNRRTCTSTNDLQQVIAKCPYCKGHHGIKRCKKRENDLQRIKKDIPEMQYIRNKEGLGQELETWPDLEIARWVKNKSLEEEYKKCMEKDGNYQGIWKETMEGKRIPGIQEKEGFLYIYKGRKQQTTGGWRLIIPRNFNLKGMSAKEALLHEAHDQTGYGGLVKTYSYLQDKYSWIGQYQDTKEFVSTCNTCQLSKGTTQLPVGLLTPLAVPQRP